MFQITKEVQNSLEHRKAEVLAAVCNGDEPVCKHLAISQNKIAES
jgi:hypothetical protein